MTHLQGEMYAHFTPRYTDLPAPCVNAAQPHLSPQFYYRRPSSGIDKKTAKRSKTLFSAKPFGLQCAIDAATVHNNLNVGNCLSDHTAVI